MDVYRNQVRWANLGICFLPPPPSLEKCPTFENNFCQFSPFFLLSPFSLSFFHQISKKLVYLKIIQYSIQYSMQYCNIVDHTKIIVKYSHIFISEKEKYYTRTTNVETLFFINYVYKTYIFSTNFIIMIFHTQNICPKF